VNEFVKLLEDELYEAIEKKDREAVHHFVTIVVNNFENKKESKEMNEQLLLKLSEIEITVKEGFKAIDKRFEDMQKYMDKRFEALQIHNDKRFEEMYKYMDKRFEEMQKHNDKRFEDLLRYSENRFEDMNRRFEDMNKRFEDMNRRFTMMFTFMNLWFGILTALVILFKFIR